MGLAIGWDTPDGAPTMTTYLIVALLSVLAAVTVMLSVRWLDKRQREREAQPWRQLVIRNRETAERLAAQVERETRILGEIRHELTGADANSQPQLKIVRDA